MLLIPEELLYLFLVLVADWYQIQLEISWWYLEVESLLALGSLSHFVVHLKAVYTNAD